MRRAIELRTVTLAALRRTLAEAEVLLGLTARMERDLDAPDNVKEAASGTIGMSDRLDTAITRNNRAMDAARGRMLDAVGTLYILSSALGAPVRQPRSSTGRWQRSAPRAISPRSR